MEEIMAAVEKEVLIKDAEARKAGLEKRARSLEADLNALMGAIQDCEFWIAWFKGEIKPEQTMDVSLPEGVKIVGIEEFPETAATEDGGRA
jgi:hypothetical protein